MAALRAYADQALQDSDLYDITNYGWTDHDTIDPSLAGHALWQTRPPAEPDWQSIFDGGMPRTNPSLAQETLVSHEQHG